MHILLRLLRKEVDSDSPSQQHVCSILLPCDTITNIDPFLHTVVNFAVMLLMTRLPAYSQGIDPPPKTCSLRSVVSLACLTAFSVLTVPRIPTLLACIFSISRISSHLICFRILSSCMIASATARMKKSVELARLVLHDRTIRVCR